MILKYLAFPVDLISFMAWIKTTFPSMTFLGFAQRGSLELVFGPSGAAQLTLDQQNTIKAYYASLTQSGEATKLALPSRLTGAAKDAHDALVANMISTKTWDQLSAAQKKVIAGGTLTNDEYDSLPVS